MRPENWLDWITKTSNSACLEVKVFAVSQCTQSRPYGITCAMTVLTSSWFRALSYLIPWSKLLFIKLG